LKGVEDRELSCAFTRRHSDGHVTKAAYTCVRGVYMLQGTKYVRAPRKPAHEVNELLRTP
jgi:hypothetical protein